MKFCVMSTPRTNLSTFEPDPDHIVPIQEPDYSISVRLLRNACMYLDEILRVDRCRDIDELINF